MTVHAKLLAPGAVAPNRLRRRERLELLVLQPEPALAAGPLRLGGRRLLERELGAEFARFLLSVLCEPQGLRGSSSP